MTWWRRGFDRGGRYVKWSKRIGKGRVLTLLALSELDRGFFRDSIAAIKDRTKIVQMYNNPDDWITVV